MSSAAISGEWIFTSKAVVRVGFFIRRIVRVDENLIDRAQTCNAHYPQYARA